MKNLFSCRFLLLLALLNGAAYGLLAAEWRPQPTQHQAGGPDLPGAAVAAYKIQVYPNPNAGRFRLEIEGAFTDTVQLIIINVEGKRVYEREIDRAGEFLFNLTTLRKGIYFAQIREGNKVVSCPILYAYDPEEQLLPGTRALKP
ncbi:MAG: T9SS type A sorting domain-containing protein [Bacteroidetes bacterium]|nr:T9SS type A sorting domain-containing protein [Bacteroidota bacterium]